MKTPIFPFLFLLILPHTASYTANRPINRPFTLPTRLSSTSSSLNDALTPGRTDEDITLELSKGVALNGGETVDYEGVNLGGSSNAEIALVNARRTYLSSSTSLSKSWDSGSGLVGINDEVVEAVGRNFMEEYEGVDVQSVAEWIRGGKKGGEVNEKYKKFLDKVYVDSGDITSAFAKTFHLGTQLMSPSKRRSIWAVYVWCRRTDEIVDAERKEGEGRGMLDELAEWEVRLERMWEEGTVVDPLDLALLDTKLEYPGLSITPFSDMVMGMLMDVPNLGQDRYKTFDELHLYCYRVAGTVGLMSTPIFGVEKEGEEGMMEAKEPALSLGVAFQLTNILRDVGEDADRGRIYLPKEDMDRFGVTEDDIMGKRMTKGYREMMKFQIDRARRYYKRARRGVRMLKSESRVPVQASLDCYSMILDKIEENDYDNFGLRAYVSKEEKLMTLPLSWYRCQDISRWMKLPGDEEEVGGE